MQAIGLLETKGLLAAIEGADAMVKSANVSIIDKTYVGGGLVTITIEGDVGAVKASVEAGAAAVRSLSQELLISEHIIPRPHEELEIIFGDNSKKQKEASVVIEVAEEESLEEIIELEEIVELEAAEVKVEEPIIEAVEESQEEVLADNVEINIVQEVKVEKRSKKDIDELFKQGGIEAVVEVLNGIKVVKLRNLAREYENFEISGRAISKADKNLLLSKFKKYYER